MSITYEIESGRRGGGKKGQGNKIVGKGYNYVSF